MQTAAVEVGCIYTGESELVIVQREHSYTIENHVAGLYADRTTTSIPEGTHFYGFSGDRYLQLCTWKFSENTAYHFPRIFFPAWASCEFFPCALTRNHLRESHTTRDNKIHTWDFSSSWAVAHLCSHTCFLFSVDISSFVASLYYLALFCFFFNWLPVSLTHLWNLTMFSKFIAFQIGLKDLVDVECVNSLISQYVLYYGARWFSEIRIAVHQPRATSIQERWATRLAKCWLYVNVSQWLL